MITFLPYPDKNAGLMLCGGALCSYSTDLDACYLLLGALLTIFLVVCLGRSTKPMLIFILRVWKKDEMSFT